MRFISIPNHTNKGFITFYATLETVVLIKTQLLRRKEAGSGSMFLKTKVTTGILIFQ